MNMDGGADFSTTPRLNLFKPNYKKDAGRWGDHYNQNFDTLDQAVGIWNAGYVNVLAYGADPTGQTDSADAINEAASQMGPNGHRLGVYLPTGNYYISKQIRLTDGQSFFGDGEGSTYLVIYDNFDRNASSIILCTGSVIDPGPTIKNLGFWFIQPNDVSSRSTFAPLGTGTSHTPGGSGVQYPWAISTQGNSGRIQIQHVVIMNAWNGIDADRACYWIDGLKISAYNIGISIGGTIAAPVADWAHLSDIEFWTFGMPWPGQSAIFQDGNTIAMRIGCQNGLTAQNISCFASRLVFTPEARFGWFTFSNLAMDSGQSSIEVAHALFLQITNLYSTAGGAASTRWAIDVVDCQSVQITNWYAFSSDSPQGLLRTQNGTVSVDNAFLLFYTPTADCIQVSHAGVLRINNSSIAAIGPAGAWARPLINQYDGGVLQVDTLHMPASAGTTGISVQMNKDNQGNYLGAIEQAPGWRTWFANEGENTLGHYGNVRVFRPENDFQSFQCGSFSFGYFGKSLHYSTAFGWAALGLHQDAGQRNTAFGNIAGYGVTTGTMNSFFGFASGYGVPGGGPITGNRNSAFGDVSGYTLNGGNDNSFFGASAGIGIINGSGNIRITTGQGVGGAGDESNTLRIGTMAVNVLAATNINTATPHVFVPWLRAQASFTSDASAAAGGVGLGELYRNGSVVQVRVT